MSQAGDMTEILLTGTLHPYLNQTKGLHSSQMWAVHFVKCCFLVFLKNLAAADYAILALKILVFNLKSNIPSWSSIFSVMAGWCDGFLGINQGAIMRAMD